MKPSMILFLLSILFLGLASAQDTTQTRKRSKGTDLQQLQKSQSGKTLAPGKGKQLNMESGVDRFIDLDGDGICDGRASGMGFMRRMQGMKMLQTEQGKGEMKRMQRGKK